MLLKCCQTEKKPKMAGNTQKRSADNNMRLTSVTQTAPARVQRKVVRNIALKRTHRGVKEEPAVEPPCDNSNDSGLGFEQHQECNVALRLVDWPVERAGWADESPELKRKRLEIKIESDDANDNFSFPDSARQRTESLLASPAVYPAAERMSAPRPIKRRQPHKDVKPPRGRANPPANQPPGPESAAARDGSARLVIVGQPEQQHRARYQTEGSRGAVKDRTGNGFPQVQLSGWLGPATLEVFIGSDCGKVVPHMFYQACRVSGKNSTQCQERTEDGTVIIEVPFEPTKDMVVTCDCVGILKERNVDVEHRFPEQSGSRNKKKSTRCRMVFRTLLIHPDGSQETLQICSQPIACTQPPGVPEICKKSLSSSPAGGGSELFILGKNFLKDTRVLFTNPDLQPPWEASVIPDKEYLQQSHLVCVVPPYLSPDISEPVTVRLTVTSSDKSSEAHCFAYTPQQRPVDTAEEESRSVKAVHPEVNPPAPESVGVAHSSLTTASLLGPAINSLPHKTSAMNNAMEPMLPPPATQYLLVEPKQGVDRESIFPLVMWKSAGCEGARLMSVSSRAKDLKLLSQLPAACKSLQPPALVPLRPATAELKGEDTSLGRNTERPHISEGMDLRVPPAGQAVSMATGADLSGTLPPSMATLRRFVAANDNGSPLPSLSVENFLSRLERKPDSASNCTNIGTEAPQPDEKPVTLGRPEYVPPESVASPINIAQGGQPPQIVSKYRRLSEKEMTLACLESNRAVGRKPGTGKLLDYVTPINPVPEQLMFPVVEPTASGDIHRSNGFLSRDPDASSATESGNVGIIDISRLPSLPLYDEGTSGLRSRSEGVPNVRNETSPFNGYADESVRAPPAEPKDGVTTPLLKPFENVTIAPLPTDSMSGDFVAVTTSVCSPPVASKIATMPPQVLPELDNNNQRPGNFHCASLPPIVVNSRPLESPIGDGFAVPEAISPVEIKNAMMPPQELSPFGGYVPETVSDSSVSQNDIVVPLLVETKCQTLGEVNLNIPLLDSNVSNVFSVKNQVSMAAGPPLFAGKNVNVCPRDNVYNFPPEDVSSLRSLPIGCISSHNALRLSKAETGYAATDSVATSPVLDIFNNPATFEAGSRRDPLAPEVVTGTLGSLPSATTLDNVPSLLPSVAAMRNLVLDCQKIKEEMSLRVDVSSTMRMISQPGAVTPETARLDALVNSALDGHVRPAGGFPTETPARFGLQFACVRAEGGGMLPHDLTQMSDHDLISYINPSCFDQV